MDSLEIIPLLNLLVGFVPTVLVIIIMQRWMGNGSSAVIANVRMLVQLLLIGYVLTYVLETERAWLVCLVVLVMLGASAWIALRPLVSRNLRLYLIALVAIGGTGLSMLVLVTQLILELERWFEPRYLIPLGGMIFANAMNTVSLAAERFQSEQGHGLDYTAARSAALDAALIPQINALLAVGLVSLPGMMTGQILSGVDPLIAARYQIMVMCMIFGSAGLAAACYLYLLRSEPEGSGLGDAGSR